MPQTEGLGNALPMKDNETVGELLRKTRLSKKQDLRDIASSLCIRYQFLQALENNCYSELPGEAYANGFVRSYASYLGLDPSDVVTRYKQEFFMQEKTSKKISDFSVEETENMLPAPKVLLGSFLCLILFFGLWSVFSSPQERDQYSVDQAKQEIPLETSVRPKESSFKTSSVSRREKVSVKNSAPVSSINAEKNTSSTTKKTEKKEVVSSAKPVDKEKENSARVSDRVETQESEAIAQLKKEPPAPRTYGEANSNPRLVIVALEETWIEVKRNDTILFSKVLNKGDRYQVSPDKPEELLLKTGNAGGLEMYCDGRLTQPLGKKGAVRSKISLKPDDYVSKIVQEQERE